MRGLRALLADDSGEFFAVLGICLLASTLIIGGAEVGGAAYTDATLGEAGKDMAKTAADLKAKYESNPELRKRLSEDEKKRLYAKWRNMSNLGRDIAAGTDSDLVMEAGEIVLDLGVTAASGGGSKLVDGVGLALDAKEGYDIARMKMENLTPGGPEVNAFTAEMVRRLDGRKSADEFLVPARKTAAYNLLADLDASRAHRVAVNSETPATMHEIGDRMASAVTDSYTQLRRSGAITEDGTYADFVRQQAEATHPDLVEKAKVGDILADKTAQGLFDQGKCDVLLATVKTEQGPVLVELKREDGGRITATSLATREPVVAVLSEGDGKPKKEQPAEEKPVYDAAPGEIGDTAFVVPERVRFAIAPGWNVEMDFALTVHEGGAVDGYFGGVGQGKSESDYWEYIGPFQGKMDKKGTVTASGNARVTVMMLDNMSVSGRRTRAFKVVGVIVPVQVDGKSTYSFTGVADGRPLEAYAVK